MFDKSDLVYSYTRQQALKDGVLFDVTPQALHAGFRVPVALTARVWAECVYWPETETAMQDEAGRLWDLLFMAVVAARRTARTDGGCRAPFDMVVVPRGGRIPRPTSLVLHIGPGDNAEPVVTIMRPSED